MEIVWDGDKYIIMNNLTYTVDLTWFKLLMSLRLECEVHIVWLERR